MAPLRIGTRGSALALAQAESVAGRIAVETELVVITTAGDRGEHIEDKSRWVSALERALLDERIDVAVHSAKDVPNEIPDGLELVGVPEREDPFDALIGANSLEAVPVGGRIGTSSLRRGAQLRALRPDLEIVELRGNVPTRLGKLDAGDLDAIVLGAAGLIRLGLEDRIGARLTQCVPAPGQGALLLEARAGDPGLRGTVVPDDAAASRQLRAERDFCAAVGASCHTPVGAYASLSEGLASGPAPCEVELSAWAGLPDGSEWIADTLAGAPEAVGAALAERMLAAGARELLDRSEELAA